MKLTLKHVPHLATELVHLNEALNEAIEDKQRELDANNPVGVDIADVEIALRNNSILYVEQMIKHLCNS